MNDLISEHEVKVFLALRQSRDAWRTSNEIGKASGVAYRTARAHTARMAERGILQVRKVFPGHRFRLVENPEKRDPEYIKRMEEAIEAFEQVAAREPKKGGRQ
jgi:hypothetical protein